MTQPASNPMPKADTVLATAKGTPIIPAVISSMLGSVTGEATQNAMTGAMGRPRRSRVDINGSTPRPQTGVIAPMRLAITTDRTVPPFSQNRARSDQRPIVRAPASREATTTTGSNVNRPRPIADSMSVLAAGVNDPAASKAPVTGQIKPIRPGRIARGRQRRTAVTLRNELDSREAITHQHPGDSPQAAGARQSGRPDRYKPIVPMESRSEMVAPIRSRVLRR